MPWASEKRSRRLSSGSATATKRTSPGCAARVRAVRVEATVAGPNYDQLERPHPSPPEERCNTTSTPTNSRPIKQRQHRDGELGRAGGYSVASNPTRHQHDEDGPAEGVSADFQETASIALSLPLLEPARGPRRGTRERSGRSHQPGRTGSHRPASQGDNAGGRCSRRAGAAGSGCRLPRTSTPRSGAGQIGVRLGDRRSAGARVRMVRFLISAGVRPYSTRRPRYITPIWPGQAKYLAMARSWVMKRKPTPSSRSLSRLRRLTRSETSTSRSPRRRRSAAG